MRLCLTAGLVMPTLLSVMPPLLLTSQATRPAVAQTTQERETEANHLFNQGIQQYHVSQFEAALQSWQQALVVYQKLKNRKGEGRSLGALGLAYYFLSDYAKAIDYHQQNLTISRMIRDRLGEGSALGNLGLVYSELGDYTKAIDYYQQSLSIARELKDYSGQGDTLGNLGLVYRTLGDYTQAINCHQQSLAIYQRLKDSFNSGKELGNLGSVYNKLGDYAKAIDYHQQSLVIAQTIRDRLSEGNALGNLGLGYRALGNYAKAINYDQQALTIAQSIKDRSGEGKSLGNLGLNYFNLGDYAKAINYHQQSLSIAREIKNRSGEGSVLNNLGSIYSVLGDYAKAIDYHQQALAIAQNIKNRSGEAESLGNLGNAYDVLGDYAQAINYYQQSLAIVRAIKDRLVEGQLLNNLGAALHQSGNLVEAERNLFEGIQAYESLRVQLGNNDANKITIFEEQARTYRLLQQVLIAQNKSTLALEISERGRARALVELLERRLQESNRRKQTPTQLPTIAQIQQIARAQNATLVEYSIVRDEFENQGKKEWRDSTLYIWVVSPTGKIDFRKADLTALKTPINQLVISSREAIGVRGRGASLKISEAFLRQELEKQRDSQSRNLKQLHKLLIEPIADLLPKDVNDRVVFVPQGALFLVPFPALQDAKGKYLIEQHTILTAPAIQALALTHQKAIAQRSNNAAKGTALVVGNPTMPKVTFKLGEPPVQLSNLPGARDEAIAIAQLLNTKPILGQQATKAEVVKQMAKARIIHLATHGLLDNFKGDTPGAIALGASGNGEINDGLLTSGEIFDMKLNADLVVLSACDTGRGDLTGDGVIGLSRTLFIAGVPSVIVSLWSVPDAPTTQLMSQFYRNLQQPNTNKAQALRQAMLTTMKSHPSPIDWAAFTLIGEP